MSPAQSSPFRTFRRNLRVRCERLPVKKPCVSISGEGTGAVGWQCGTRPRRERATMEPLCPRSRSETSTSITVRLVPISRTEASLRRSSIASSRHGLP